MTVKTHFGSHGGKNNGSNGGNGNGTGASGYTGRYLVSFDPSASLDAVALLADKAGLRAASSHEVNAADGAHENVVYEEIGVAVVDAPPDAVKALNAAVHDTAIPIERMEPERIVWAIGLDFPSETRSQRSAPSGDEMQHLLDPGEQDVTRADGEPSVSYEFLRGYAAAINGLLATLPAEGRTARALLPELALDVEAALTWGLQVTGVNESSWSGRGVRIAVLDTGMELHHPDFSDRVITSQSFVDGETAQDKNGHGTHCIGTACGPRYPTLGQRYGIAYDAEIFAGKVLSNAGSGADGGILAGINWAVRNRCAIISMSLGAPTAIGEPHSEVYENVARIAAAKGSIIVAAAGNDSARPSSLQPVAHPANCPSIVAVGALDTKLGAAPFSNGALNRGGGEVNIAAPGVDVYSSWRLPQRYRSISGTSMATPHVAGIGALLAEGTGLRGFALANALLRRARRLFPIRDFGWGLVRAR